MGALQALVDQSPVATLVFGLPDQRIEVANEAAAALIGSPQWAIVGLRPAQVWDGDDGALSQAALSGLTVGAIDSYRACRHLRTSRGPAAVSVWVRRMKVIGGSVAVVIVVPETMPRSTTESVDAFFGPEVLDLAVGERIAELERHLLQFAAELHAGGWRDVQPLAVDASRLAALDKLSKRQREVVVRLLRGERIPSIAVSMYVSASTVRNHLSHVFATFGVHSQSELLALLRSPSDADRRGEPEHRP
jgi:DNA-binding CsgD family transcriptional regulator